MKIFAVGMNYAQHNKELDGTLYKPEKPVIFTKADSALLKDRKPFFIPDWSSRVDYETELVVRICRLGKSIPERFAYRYYDAMTVGIDFTARDWQREARDNGLPWEICKGFDGSAAIGEWQSIPQPLKKEGGLQALRYISTIIWKDGSKTRRYWSLIVSETDKVYLEPGAPAGKSECCIAGVFQPDRTAGQD